MLKVRFKGMFSYTQKYSDSFMPLKLHLLEGKNSLYTLC